MDITTDAPGVAAPEAISTAFDVDAGSSEHSVAIITASTVGATVAAEINREHQLANGCAKEAVRHAIRCGELLTEQKKALPHGEFSKWIGIHCTFAYSTAARYMKAAATNLSGVEISSLSALFPSGRKSESASQTSPGPTPRAQVAPERTPAVSATPPSAAPDSAFEQAFETIRRQPNFSRKYGRLLTSERDARKELQRAQVAHRNAVASILAAARRIEAATEGTLHGAA